MRSMGVPSGAGDVIALRLRFERTGTDSQIPRDRLARRLAALAVRQRVMAGSRIFEPGMPARDIIVVEAGSLLVHKARRGGRPLTRRHGRGEIMAYDCDGARIAGCVAVVDSTIWRIDRRKLREAADAEPELAGLIVHMHARELEFVMSSLAADDAGGARLQVRQRGVVQRQAGSVEASTSHRADEHHGSAGAVVLTFPAQLRDRTEDGEEG